MQSLHLRSRFAPTALILLLFHATPLPVCASGLGSCLWGGSNEETTYTAPYVPALGRMYTSASTYAPSPDANLNAPPGTVLPVRTDAYGTMQIPQAQIPGQAATGAVGTITQPATLGQDFLGTTAGQGAGTVLYVLPGEEPEKDSLRPNSRIAVASDVVPAGTPGAVPVTVRQQAAYRAESETRWTFDWTTNTRLTRVDVVNPRTGRLVRTYYKQEEVRSLLPWFHPKETVDYVPVTVPVATPAQPARSRRAATPQTYVPQTGLPNYTNGASGSTTTLVN